MAHTYASLTDFKKHLVEGGTEYGTANDGPLLAILESVSRRVDTYCERSPGWGSGFGPRVGTNYYDPVRGATLELDDDLLTITSVSTYDTIGGTATTLTVDTDFYREPYGGPPYRRLCIHEESSKVWGSATRGQVIVGKWGYQDDRVTSASVTTEALDASETGVDVTAGSDFEVGQTILIDTEQMYVSAIASNTLTVVRASNGTTAATHSTSAAIDVYRYPAAVKDGTLAVAMRRWRNREANVTGDFGGGGLPTVTPRDTEWSILNATVGHLCYRSAA